MRERVRDSFAAVFGRRLLGAVSMLVLFVLIGEAARLALS
jgi:hypothetical protein